MRSEHLHAFENRKRFGPDPTRFVMLPAEPASPVPLKPAPPPRGRLKPLDLVRFVLPLLLTTLSPVHAQTPLASPAIDYQAFREGEVQRSQAVFGSWTTVCDELKHFRQRFCSLRSRAVDQLNRPIADIVVSTADDGRPAGLITVGLGMRVDQPLVLEPAPPATVIIKPKGKIKGGNKAPQPPLPARLAARLCDAAGCQMFWPLTGEDIATLRDGRDIYVSFQGAYVHVTYPYPPMLQWDAVPLRGVFHGVGFSDAIAASLK
jgi:hypothetical protein